jgi:hypothetical protein
MTKREKYNFLLENGWWCHYTPNCWFESSKDTQYLNDKGVLVGFRPKSEGIPLQQAFKICIINLATENGKRRNNQHSKYSLS